MNIYSIPAGVSFVDALAQGLLARAEHDPLKLAGMTVLVPNRRAVRSLREAFLRKSKGAALLLPLIRPIGDVDEDALSLGPGVETLETLVAIDPMRRQLVLAQYLTAAFGDRFTTAQALAMAADLGRLVDSVHTEGLTLDNLDSLVPEKYAAHWQDVLTFLKKVLRTHWPRMLEKENAVDPGLYRRLMIEAYTASLIETPPTGPIIAAGSTGSIPATADLLKTVAALPNGMVVLPGLDRLLDDESWNDFITEGHPQAGLQKLLDHIGITRAQVQNWDDTPASAREHLISTLMRPAETLSAWTNEKIPAEAFDNLTLIEADTLDAEAAAIAGIMRKHADNRDAAEPCVLATPDRVLALRVSEYLKRWNIVIDDSGGVPLSRTPVGAWLLLMVDVLKEDLAPVSLLALLKHGLAGGGPHWPADAPAFRSFVRDLDMALRGTRPAPGFKGLFDHITDKNLKSGLRALEKLFAPIVISTDLPARLRALVLLAENLAGTGEQSGGSRLWVGDAGEAAANMLAGLFEQSDVLAGLDFDWDNIRSILEAAMEQVSIRPRFGTHPRLAILGPIEARLYQAGTMILGGLNEGTWPRVAEVDGWMSRDMRKNFGLPAPERAITLSAHDFCQGFGAKTVILTRGKNRDGAPTIPSRWLQRLDAICAATKACDIREKGAYWLSLAGQMDAGEGKAAPIGRPEFNPPLSSRPRTLRVTDIAKLRSDPYGIYARHVLHLKPLDPLDTEPDHRERGTLIHKALEEYTKAFPKDLPDNAYKQLIAIGEKVFADAHAHPDIYGHWWPRFQRMARALINFENMWRLNMQESWAERDATMEFPMQGGAFTLTGRADRIERRNNGWAIIDYKSGGTPKKGEVTHGDEPQLTLLGAMLLRGHFNKSLSIGHTPDTIDTLAYWPAGGTKENFEPKPVNEDDLNGLCERAQEGLADIIRAYLEEGIPYICWPDPERKLRDDYEYAHLGRIAEWSDDEGEEAA